jgi:hypothetical protein
MGCMVLAGVHVDAEDLAFSERLALLGAVTHPLVLLKVSV